MQNIKRISKPYSGGAHTYSKGIDQFPENVPGAIKKGKEHMFGIWKEKISGLFDGTL